MRPMLKKVLSPLLFIATVVLSIVIVSQVVGRREDSSPLLVDNGPANDGEDNDDGGLRTADDEFLSNYTDTGLTSFPPTVASSSALRSPIALPSYSPSTLLPSSQLITMVSTPTPTEMASSSAPTPLPTTRPSTFSPTTSEPTSSSPTPLPTSPPTTSKPTTSKPTSSSPSSRPSTSEPTSSSPSSRPSSTPTKAPTKAPRTSEPSSSIVDQTIETDIESTTSFYTVTNSCLKQNDIKSESCLSEDDEEHTSPIAVNCCSGSMSNDNLTCRRNGCFKTTSFIEAKDHCEKDGMRLCTVDELDSGICCNKGCGFNNKLTWTADSCVPTISPTKNPTSSPTARTGTLVTFNNSDGDRSIGDDNESSSLGLVFEIQALRDLEITSLSTFTESESKIWSEVWIRKGRYEGNMKGVGDGWERVYFKKSQQYGSSAPLDIAFDRQVFVPEGQIISLYLISPGKFLSEQEASEGDVIAEDSSLKLYAGAAVNYGRWADGGCKNGAECKYAGSFNGAISYATATMAPTVAPTPDGNTLLSSGLTLREEQWLDGHNTRREKYHKQYGQTYRPLKWSTGLKEMAQEYADKLASVCGPTVHDSYESRGGYGENLASNTGFDRGAGSWGELKPVDLVMTRFVEREQYWKPPDNFHYTQVLWRSSTHVGCADSVGTRSNGAVCRYQVCRYSRAGNCDVDRFNDGSEEWWMEAVLNDQSSCQPFCPPEGCD